MSFIINEADANKRGSMLIAPQPTAGVAFQQKIYSVSDFVMFFWYSWAEGGKGWRIGNKRQGKVQVHLR